MKSNIIQRLKTLCSGAALVTASFAGAALVPGNAISGQPTHEAGSYSAGSMSAAACQGPSLIQNLRGLRSSAAIKVRRTANELVVLDVVTQKAIFTANCKTVTQHGDTAEAPRPAERRPASTKVRRDAAGTLVYTHSVTARGARATVFSKGRVFGKALHLTSFDNDDFHIADGEGALIHSVTTKSDGTLVEREGKGYGCGCERVTNPDGKTETRPLP